MSFRGDLPWREQSEIEYKEPQRPKPKPWSGETKNRAQSPSPLYVWHFKQKELQRQGLLNEIDTAEIRQAQRGVKNGWYLAVNDDPKPFHDLLSCAEGKNGDKQKADLLWQELKNKKHDLEPGGKSVMQAMQKLYGD